MIEFRPTGALRAAVAFLTRIPVGATPLTPGDEQWAPTFFPLVGALLGLFGAAVASFFRPLGGMTAALIALTATVVATGALHEDGLADTCDALGANGDRAKKLAVMKDSRVGSFGAIALVLSLGIRAALVAKLGESAWGVWPLAATLARTGAVVQLASLEYVTDASSSKSKGVVGGGREVAVAALAVTGSIAALCIFLGRLALSTSVVAVAISAIAAMLASLYFRRTFGGITGDLMGATEQLSEVLVLAAFAWS